MAALAAKSCVAFAAAPVTAPCRVFLPKPAGRAIPAVLPKVLSNVAV